MSGMEGFNTATVHEAPEEGFASREAMASAVMNAADGVFEDAREQYAATVGGNENHRNLKYKNGLGNIFTTAFAVVLNRLLGLSVSESEDTAVFTYGLLLAEGQTMVAFGHHVKETLGSLAAHLGQIDAFPLGGAES